MEKVQGTLPGKTVTILLSIKENKRHSKETDKSGIQEQGICWTSIAYSRTVKFKNHYDLGKQALKLWFPIGKISKHQVNTSDTPYQRSDASLSFPSLQGKTKTTARQLQQVSHIV